MIWYDIKEVSPPENIDIFIRWDDYTYENICERYSYIEAGEGFHQQFATHWAEVEHPSRFNTHSLEDYQ